MQAERADTRSSTPATFAALLRALREAAGLSQEELAERSRLSAHAVSALERGARTRPYPHTVRALADALDASQLDRAALIAAVPSKSRGLARASSRDAVAVGRLPAPPTPLVAREDEVRRIAALVRDPAQRLVTLTGTGGVGKTRLSIAVAAAETSSFADGVTFVELASLLDADLVLPAIADRVGAGGLEAGAAEGAVIAHLQARQLLLVLDNFEHLLVAAPQVARLLETCPGVTVLVTSRAPLRLRGETEVAVPPLGVPTRDSPEAVAQSPAGALLLARAQAVSAQLHLTPANAAALAGICRRLAGIPLALELAAARTRFLDPPTLLSRLDATTTVEGARDLPARQRTMQAALDWSYGLLGEREQALLRLVSVFCGGFRIDDVEAVAELSGTVRPSDVLRLLESLVEQSLVVAVVDDGRLRHHLLEPVAEYGRTMLTSAGESAAIADAHACHFLGLAERAAPHYQRTQQVEWLARIDAEHENLSAAMEHALRSGAADLAGRLGWALWLYWWLRGHLLHGRRSMEAALAHPLSAAVRTRAEIAAATMAFALDDVEASRAWWQSAGDRARATGDLLSQANSLAGVGLAALASGDVETATRELSAAVPLAEAAGEEGEWISALTQVWLGTTAMLGGDLARAIAHVERGLSSARRRGDRLTTYVALYNLSQAATAGGDGVLARRHLEEGLRLSRETHDLANLAYFLDALAVVESFDGAHARVPVLLGAAQGIRDSIGTRGYGYYRPNAELGRLATADARANLGEDRFDDALDIGRAMEPRDAVGYGLEGSAASA